MSRLRQERERRGWKKSRLVLELEHRAAAHKVSLATTSSLMRMLARWENTGSSVDPPYRELFCEIYGLAPEDFGWPAYGQTTRVTDGEGYRPSLASAVAELNNLIGHDLARNPGLLSVGYDANALASATLDWLFAVAQDDLARTGSLVVTSADVAEIREATLTFDQLDRRVSGDQSREVAARYMRDRLMPRIHGTYSETVGRELFAATAILCEIIGWMAYDTGRHSAGQRYFTQALRMAEEANDRALGSFILASMSDQALYLRHPEQALRLARAASDRAGSVAVVGAEAAVLEARSQAVLSDVRACADALGRAERHLSLAGVADRPDWSSPFDEVVFASHAGTCFVDLGEATRAEHHFQSVLEQLHGQPRRQVYGTIQLARVALLDRDVDQASALGTAAFDAINGLESSRSRRHVDDLAVSLKPHMRNRSAREFVERITGEAGTSR